jgi:hypothetical protein
MEDDDLEYEVDFTILDRFKSKKTLKTLTSSNSDEHNTPSYLVEAAREVLGVIDLDPMSNALANETIGATTYYTKEDDGLSKDWLGNVWLNPPFSLSKLAIPKLVNSYELGDVSQAVLLVKSDVSTQKYKLLYPYPFCELNKRVKFISHSNNAQGSPFPVVMFYLGKNYYMWNKVMSLYGKVHPGNNLFTRLVMRVSLEDLKDLEVIEL